jgi:hypothetical protein
VKSKNGKAEYQLTLEEGCKKGEESHQLRRVDDFDPERRVDDLDQSDVWTTLTKVTSRR